MSGCAPEVFISYAHADDEYPRYESRDWEGSRGWVDCFYHALRKRLQQLRRGTEIWRDADGGIRGASPLTPAIEQGIANASIFVAINSPAYAASEWCEKELGLFEQSVKNRGGLRAGDFLRVFKIDKLPVPGTSFLTRIPELADNVGYPFFRNVEGSPLEFEPLSFGAPGTKFLSSINTVACDIVAALQGHTAVAPPSGINVYLAETSADASGLRFKLQGELEQYGHSIRPRPLGPRLTDYVAEVCSGLRVSSLSVHVIGGQVGPVRDELGGRSEVEIQYELAGEESAKRSDFMRLAWLAPVEGPVEPAQALFRARLQDTDPQLIVAPLEEVRTLIKQQLEIKPVASRSSDSAGVRIVYLMFDAPDEDRAKPVASWLFDQGFEVLRPARSGNLLRAHKVNMRDSHGALIYYGEVNDDWLAVKLGDLRKRLGEPRGHELRGAVYLADPQNDEKSEFRSRLFDVIPGFGRFRPEVLATFVEKVRGSSKP